MKSRWNSLVVGSCNVFGLALLALSATAGGSAVRAGDPSTLQNLVSEPVAKIVLGIEQRVADLEATIAAFAGSFTAGRIVTQQLCVADESGMQTCITKAQLDALLRTAVQVGQAPAPIESSTSERTASADKLAAPVAAVTTPAETLPAIESPDAVGVLATAAVASPPVDKPVAAVEEAKMPMSEMATAPLPVAGQPAAEAVEAAAQLSAAATVASQATEPAQAAVVASAKPETLVAAERPATDEEPAHTGSVMAKSPAPELTATPTEGASISERTE